MSRESCSRVDERMNNYSIVTLSSILPFMVGISFEYFFLYLFGFVLYILWWVAATSNFPQIRKHQRSS